MNLQDQKLSEKWKIGESVLDVLIGGVSFLDSKHGFEGNFQSLADAEGFLNGYGFDLADPIESAELHGSLKEALTFIRTYFLKPQAPEGLALEIPKKFLEITDIRELLYIASHHSSQAFRNWACAILKVVHILSHVDRDMRTHYFSDIQIQILDRYYRYLGRGRNEQLFLGRHEDDPLRVDLVEFQVKPKKARDSTLMKLLHKPGSVAEELFDRVGVRIVTKSRVDCIRAIKFLDQLNIVVPANIKPSRSRNTLINTEQFRHILESELGQVREGKLSEELMCEHLEAADVIKGGSHENPHSSEFYRAIQFTCRQLIKIKNPLADHIRNLKSSARHAGHAEQLPEDLRIAIDRVDQKYIQRVTRFFYPYEVQIMDQASFIENEKGRSAHAHYKLAQQNAAMLRVMGPLAHSS